MTILIRKYSTLNIFFLPIALLTLMWFFPKLELTLGIIYLMLGLVGIGYWISRRYRESYLQGLITQTVMFRKISVEMTTILLAMFLAAKIGRYLAVIGTRQINHEMIRLLTGLAIGLLAGAVTGALIKAVSNLMVRN